MIMKTNDKTEVKEDNEENKDPIVKEDGVKLSKIYNLNDKIVEKFEVTLNGKTKKISTTYNYK